MIGKGHRSTKRKSFTWHMSVITVNPSGATRQHSLVFCKVFYQPVLLLSAIVVSALRITASGYNSSNIFSPSSCIEYTLPRTELELATF